MKDANPEGYKTLEDWKQGAHVLAPLEYFYDAKSDQLFVRRMELKKSAKS